MKLYIKTYLIIFLSFFLFNKCSKDNPTGPSEKPPQVLATGNIGSNGGTIKTQNIEITIPAGAFNSTEDLKILKSTEENSFNNNLASDLFILDGLPQEIAEPIKIKIKYKGTMSDSSFVAIGENNFTSSLNEKTISYHLISAEDSAGYLITTLPSLNTNILGKVASDYSVNGDKISINLGAIVGYVSYVSQQGHFRINFPSSVLTQAYDLADYLETAYSKFKSIGFSYSRRTRWPIDVTVKRLGSSVFGYSMNSMWGNNYGYMEFNFDKMDNTTEMKVTAGHEFFHLVQSLYDPRNRFSKAKFQSPNLWLDEACAVWSERLFSNSNYVSPIFDINAYEILKGAKESTGNNAQSYGYGMASFIKYLTDKRGNSSLVKVYNKIYTGKNPFSAISSVLPVNIGFSWKSFLKNLFSFKLYNGGSFTPPSMIATAKNKKNNFIIKTADDSIKTFKSKLTDLSATIFSIKNEYDKLSNDEELHFSCKDWKFQLYKVNSTTSEFLASGKDSLTLKDFKKITDKGYQIAVVLYNDDCDSPYENNKGYEMKIEVKTPPQKRIIQSIDILVAYTGTFTEKYPEKTYSYQEQRTIEGIYHGTLTELKSNTVSTVFDTTYGIYKLTSKIQITFDDINNPTQILAFSINNDGIDTYVNAKIKETAIGGNVPFSFWHQGNEYQFTYRGNISSFLSELTYLHTRSQEFTRDDGTKFTAEIPYKLVDYDSNGSIGIVVVYAK